VRTESALLRSRARLRDAMAAGRLGAWEREIGTDRMQSSAQHKANFGLAADAAFTYEMARAMRHPDDREKMDAAFRRAVEEGVPYDVETRVIWPDGSCHWMMARGDIVPDESGRPSRMAGFTMDVTERKQAEARLKLLAQEVDHRANNLLAVIQAVVRLTRADTVPDFVDAVQGRLVALARAHKLMADSRWTGADLATLVDEEMAAYRAGDEARIRTRGPAVAMSASAAQSVAMAIHELATNAVKYGALSVEGGRVEITWAWSDATGLALRWSETGGPPVVPPACRGFGTGVIDGTIRQQLKGAMHFDWRREGLLCEMTVPVESISPRRES
jgi:PAS domain S-box-containing protein